ncbi:MAG: hypothetical protein KAG34_11635 [Cocleimonas sp.]|nr:hypothetical protein [Cocleimonas sp.]
MLDPAIKDFLQERKEARIKAKTKARMSDEEKAEVIREANAAFELSAWLPFEAKRAKQIAITSHPAKFTYPSIKKNEVSFTALEAKKTADGFIRTGNVSVEEDGFGGAAGLAAYKFLTLPLSDGKTVLAHLEEESVEIQQQLNIPDTSFSELREQFLAVKSSVETDITHGRLKQVYFPVKEDYHLLSILPPSGLMFKLKERINTLKKQAREEKSKKPHEQQEFAELYNLSVIGFGGTKPQNISVLNSKNFGQAYLLESLPPALQQRTVTLPKHSFFTNTLNPWRYKDSFLTFHKLITLDYNNDNIRRGRDNSIHFIISQVIERMWAVRQTEQGWSKSDAFSHLPVYQKHWLDNAYLKRREEDRDLLDKITRDLAQWFLVSYKKIIKHTIGKEHLEQLKQIIDSNKEGLR